ncbi:cytochrome c [Extensimonas vulgaris]|jgi:hypothetical protein|uniref:Sulfite dehydrogenase (Cytochrome) subunit SorB n=1 Tax=Extensimonas vulgaris TaxID=1031594 RepID=A0A369ARL3_9BURK|nr:cytochrome c [Extensimonas vulgaris]RCX12010.1 sulfite dehydrogenase (cytochrome) subunit SorB [Extensimonas vulgaris]TWI38899.1 sulfite dehydrogenase [Extensimonas vulgaris]TXD14999.1 cytochrome c [Extensimonas vulgaris]
MHAFLRTTLLSAAVLGTGAAPLLAQAVTKTYQAPADTVFLQPSAHPGFAKTAVCAACHSAEYIVYQPPTAARPYWEAMVKRMKNVFNAPIQESDIPDIVDYLVKTYGNERPR